MNRNRREVKRESNTSGGGGQRRSRSRSPRRNRGGGGGGPSNGNSSNNKMVFITNIAYDVRWVELKTLVREKGGDVVFCELLEDRNGRPKGNAVVEFVNREDAEKCVANLTKFDFKGRSIIAKEIRDPVAFFRTIKNETGIDYLAKSGGGGAGPRGGAGGDGHGGHAGKDERPTRSGTYDLFGLNMDFLRQHNIDPPLCERIFVANLAFNVGTDKLYEVFGMAGKIVWLDFRIDKEGKTKGVCVIQYTHPIEAVQAISMFNGQRLYDRNLVVKMDRFEKLDNEPKDGSLPRGLESIGMGLGADGAPLSNVHSVFGTGAMAEPVQPFANQISNVQPFGGSVPSGFIGNGMDSSSFGRTVMSNAGPFGVTGSYVPEAVYGNVVAGGGQSSSGGRSLLIRNLPIDYTWQIVRDRLRQFGDVESVDMVNPGAARVRFGSLNDVERCRAALFGTTVEGRVINVEFV